MTTEAIRQASANVAAVQSVSGRLAHFIHGLAFEKLPPAVVECAKIRLLDCLATSLPARGMKVPELARALVQGGSGEATLIGYPDHVALLDAAFVNATLVNARSQDDFLEKSHAGAVTVPAALAIGETSGRSGAEVLVSLVAGYEVVGRAYVGGPTMLPRFRATGVAGTVGAAATAARLMGLDATGVMHALGTAACFAHGFGQGFLSGTTEVKLNVGMASRSGVAAALLASHGATASPLAFEGDAGYYRAFSNTIECAEMATQGLGERFLIENTVYKECPVCIFNQTPIALAREIAPRIDPARIVRVTIRSPELTHTNPGFTNVAPFATQLQALVSARFCTAAALLGRPVETQACYAQLQDPGVLALCERIDLVMRPEDAERVDLEVTLQDGGTVRASGVEMDTLRPTPAKIIAKFRRNTADLPGLDAERVLETVLGLERLRNVSELTKLLAGPR